MRYIWSIGLFVAILLWNVLYIFQDRWFFARQFTQLGSYERQETVMDEAQELMYYWWDQRKLVGRTVYTDAEEEHLRDVKDILRWVFLIFLCVIFMWLLVSVFLWKELLSFVMLRSLLATLTWFIFLALLLSVLAWVSWGWLFDSFHRLFFVDNWSFSAESFLIQSYPWEFFRNAMIAVLVRTLVCILLSVAVLFGVYRLRR